ncbi:glycosyltransferase [Pseudomonas fragi]|uniref:glycosyltransferase n=1 Tax=Pseudomonas fragi TaxID=296 RepID=UPI0020040FA5|nr:glycosyltransferase [Pseudomonas fragi]
MSNKIAILLATYNGEYHLREQLQSILYQTHSDWHLFIRDDGSTDGTLDIIKDYASRIANITIVDNAGEYTGSAAGNFFKLLHFSDYEGFDYISLSDQDDVWAPNKLQAALAYLSLDRAGGYSSNLISYDNAMMRTSYIDKSQAQKNFDYFFQGGSAGCTYVFTREACLLIQRKTVNITTYKGRSHDWLIYAICRANDIPWVLDRQAYIFYRQHANNVWGAKSAFSGLVSKFKILRSGWYRDNVIWVAENSGADVKGVEVFERVKRNKLVDKFYLLTIVSQLRRSKRECNLLVLILLFLF